MGYQDNSELAQESTLTLVRRIVKLVDSLSVVDSSQRQRVILDAISAGLTLPTVTTVSSITNVAAQTGMAGMDREMYINQARQAFQGIRSRLIPTPADPVPDTPIDTAGLAQESTEILLRRLTKIADALSVVDSAQRQRVVIDAITAGLTLPTVTTVSSITNVAAQTGMAGMDREMYINQARQAYSGIRSRLTYPLTVFTATENGLAPASGGGTTNFLRADGTWVAPGGGLGGSIANTQVAYGSGTNIAGSNNFVWSGAKLNTIVDDAGTTTALYPFKITRTSSGTPGVDGSGLGTSGLGVGMEFEIETASGNNEIGGTIEVRLTANGSGVENAMMIFRPLFGGALSTNPSMTIGGTTNQITINTTVFNIGSTQIKFTAAPTSAAITDGFLLRNVAAGGEVRLLTPTGTPSSTTFLRGDGTWNAPVGTFSGSTTSTRITFSTATNTLGDDADLTFNTTGNVLTLTSGKFSSGATEMILDQNGTERFRIDTSGLVGVGSSAGQTFTNPFQIYNKHASYTSIVVGAYQFVLGTTAASIAAGFGGSYKIGISGTGGTVTHGGIWSYSWTTVDSVSGLKLSANISGTDRGFLAIATDGYTTLSADESNSTASSEIRFRIDGSQKFVFDSAGIGTATNWAISSDRRLKEILSDYMGGLELIRRISPLAKEYIRKETGKIEIGYIAQELYKIEPRFVNKGEREEDMWSVNYMGLIVPMVSALTTIDDEIEQLKKRVKFLEDLKDGNTGK
jgi:hypothetical protein